MKKTITSGCKREIIGVLFLIGVLTYLVFSLYQVSAVIPGATLDGSVSVDSGPTITPATRSDGGGKIVTLNLSANQQDSAWKAYIGNVSGKFVLENANNKSIYQWPSISTATGELFIARNSSLNFSSIGCANAGNLSAENSFFGMGASDADNINNTFNATAHKAFNVGTISVAQNNCSSIATWVNDTVQTPSASAVFQEVALSDGSNIVYASILNDNQRGFDNSSYDFQAIIPDNRTGTGTSYYFFLELGP